MKAITLKENKLYQLSKMKKLNVVSLQVIREKSFPFKVDTIGSTKDAGELAREFIGPVDREHLILICLDIQYKVTAINTISIGCLNSSIVHPREVFKVAILSNSTYVILAHNHPSNDPEPSAEDVEVTERIKFSGEILGIELLDHLIVTDDSYFSIKEYSNSMNWNLS